MDVRITKWKRIVNMENYNMELWNILKIKYQRKFADIIFLLASWIFVFKIFRGSELMNTKLREIFKLIIL